MIVVSDTSPLCYLLLIDLVDLMPSLFSRVIIPRTVYNELLAPSAPEVIRSWILHPPTWLEVQSVTSQIDAGLNQLDVGEREAIALAQQLGADLIVLDDKAARQIATERQLTVIGLLGVLGSEKRTSLFFSVWSRKIES